MGVKLKNIQYNPLSYTIGKLDLVRRLGITVFLHYVCGKRPGLLEWDPSNRQNCVATFKSIKCKRNPDISTIARACLWVCCTLYSSLYIHGIGLRLVWPSSRCRSITVKATVICLRILGVVRIDQLTSYYGCNFGWLKTDRKNGHSRICLE